MEDCIFCKIVEGKVESYKIFENEKAIACLDLGPIARGHTLVISKGHFENIYDIPEQDLKDVILAVKATADILKEKLNPTGINLLQRNGRGAGQEIKHLHFHLIPRFDNDSVALPPKSDYLKKDIPGLYKLLTK